MVLIEIITFIFRDFMPNCVTDFSPFSMRIRPGKKREQISEKTRNPSMTGHSSSNSINSSSRYYKFTLISS